MHREVLQEGLRSWAAQPVGPCLTVRRARFTGTGTFTGEGLSDDDFLGALGNKGAGGHRHVGAGYGGGDEGLEDAAAGEGVARAAGKAACQMQRNPGIIDGNEEKLASVGLHERSQYLTHDADNLVLGGGHTEISSYHAA